MKIPVSADEGERLRALHRYEILDTQSERDYDDITLLASQICDAPIALISLIDEKRQWIKSKIGLEIEETPRDLAFCAHAVLTAASQPLVISDTLKDERFTANPMVVGEPHIRFYAGAPLVTPDNHSIGTLCVIDRKPRQMTGSQLQALQALARQVTTKLELRRITALLQAANEDLRNLSLTDELTGLYNLRGFLFHAEQQLKLFRKRPADDGLFLMMADIDGLKEINDIHGHHVGSEAIVEFAEIMRKIFRNSDVIARPGGDEFMVLIINAANQVKEMIAERLQKTLDEHNRQSRKPYKLSASFGLIAIDFESFDTIEEIIRQADRKMYEHKRGRKVMRT